jgi:hypothetical protein
MKEQQIIRPNEQEAYFRTQDNFEYSFNNGDSRGILPLFMYDEAETKYKKVYGERKNWAYSIPSNFVIVNPNVIDVEDMEYVLLDNNRALISRKDFYKFKGFSLETQFEMWVVSEYTDSMTSSPDFYNVLKREISQGKGYEFLKNFYIREIEFYTLCRYNFSILEDKEIVLEYKDKLDQELLYLRVDLDAIRKRIPNLDKEIKRYKKELSNFSVEDPKLKKRLDSLIRKQEKLLEKSLIFGGDQYQRELDSVTKKIDDLGSLIEDSETIRQSLLEKIESLENQRIKALELYSSFWRKIVSLEKNAETLRSGIQDALEDEGYFIRD